MNSWQKGKRRERDWRDELMLMDTAPGVAAGLWHAGQPNGLRRLGARVVLRLAASQA